MAFGKKFVTIYILGLSTFSAGPRVADKADPRQALPIALTISEGLVGFGFVDSLAPIVTRCSLSSPLVGVHAAGLEGLPWVVLEPFRRGSFVSVRCGDNADGSTRGV